MTIRIFILGAIGAMITSVGTGILVVTQLAPSKAGIVGFLALFLSIFVAVASSVGLLGYGVRRILLRQQFPAYAVRTSIRQGFMVGFFTAFLLFLQLIHLYRWWVAIALVALLGSFELFFLSYGRAGRRGTNS